MILPRRCHGKSDGQGQDDYCSYIQGLSSRIHIWFFFGLLGGLFSRWWISDKGNSLLGMRTRELKSVELAVSHEEANFERLCR